MPELPSRLLERSPPSDPSGDRGQGRAELAVLDTFHKVSTLIGDREYSAIRNSVGKRSDNAQRMRPVGGRHARSAVRHRCWIAAVVPGSAPAWVLWARHVPFCCDYVNDRQSHRAPAPGNAPPGAPDLAGRRRAAGACLDERHQDLIRDRGEQLTGDAVSAASGYTRLACRSGLFWRLGRTGATGRPGGRDELVQPAQRAQRLRPSMPALPVLPDEVRCAGDEQQVEASAEGKTRGSRHAAVHRDSPVPR